MSKKSLDRKQARQFIIESRDNGKSDQEIYNELTPLYFDKKVVAMFITGIPTKQAKEKYKLYNNILLVFIAITIISKIYIAASLASLVSITWSWVVLLFFFILPALNFYFFYAIARFEVGAYTLCALLTIGGFVQSIDKLQGTADILVSIVLTAAISGLCLFLNANLFPNYRPLRMKKDANGEYVL